MVLGDLANKRSIKHFRENKISAALLTLSWVLMIIATLWYVRGVTESFFNADMLTPHALFRDLYDSNASFLELIGHWQFPPAPYFFPDLIISFIPDLIFSDFRVTPLLDCVIQIYLLQLSIKYLYRKLFPGDNGITDIYAVLCTTTLFVTERFFPGNKQIYSICIHMSMVVISIFSLAYLIGLCIGQISTSSKAAALAISCLTIVFYAVDLYSDIIILQYFIVPAILTCLIAIFAGMVSPKKILPFMTALAGSYIVYLIMVFSLANYINVMDVYEYFRSDISLHTMLMNVKYSFESAMIKSTALFTAWLISILIFFSIMLRRWKRNDLRGEADGPAIAGIFYFFLCSATIPAYLLTNKEHFLVARYFALPAYLFVIIAFAYGLKYLRNILYQKRVIAGIIALVSVVIISGSYPISQSLPVRTLSYEFPLAQCLDNLKDKYNLSFGLSEYWNAKPATIFSKKGIRLYAVTDDLRPYHWLNNIDWYTGHNMANYDKPFYNFIVVNSLDAQLIEKQYGNPTEVLFCPDESYMIYFYGAQSGFNEKVDFFNRGASYIGKILDFKSGRKNKVSFRAVDAPFFSQQAVQNYKEGTLTISPDSRFSYFSQPFAAFPMKLPKGQYRATLNFTGSNLPNTGLKDSQIGVMEIVSFTRRSEAAGYDTFSLNTIDLVTNENAAAMLLPVNFTITKSTTCQCNIYYTGVGQFTLNSLAVERAFP